MFSSFRHVLRRIIRSELSTQPLTPFPYVQFFVSSMADNVWNAANIVLGVPGFVQVCLDVGSKVAALLDNYRNSETVAKHLALKLKTQWRNLEDILHNLGLIAEQLGVQLEKEVVEM